MSINITVTSNPVCLGQKILLSDLEQVKRHERERRKRLRLVQVRQQSKDISSKLLERAKKMARKELDRFDNHKNSEMKRMYNQKVIDVQRKYDEGMGDIGLAHISAISDPDVDVILNEKKIKNISILMQRGKEASELLKKVAQTDNRVTKHQEHLCLARGVEKTRSAMVSSLSKLSLNTRKQCSRITSLLSSTSDVTGSDENHLGQRVPSKKRKLKRMIRKISPVKVILRPNMKAIPRLRRLKSPHYISVKSQISGSKCVTANDNNLKARYTNGGFSNLGLSTTQSSTHPDSMKFKKIFRYNPNDYRGDFSTLSGNSITLVSEDSSYFSEEALNHNFKKTANEGAPKNRLSSETNKIHVYDHKNRQNSSYDRPTGVVEKIDIANKPIVEEITPKASHTETSGIKEMKKEVSQITVARHRGHRAILREKIIYDYKSLIQNLHHLSREERKLKTDYPSHSVEGCLIRSRELKGLLQKSRQQQMNRSFKKATTDYKDLDNEQDVSVAQRVVTIRSVDEKKLSHQTIPDDNPGYNSELSRKEKILEMLQKVERQKKLLLKEFSDTSSVNILSTSVKNHTSIGQQASSHSPEIEITLTSYGTAENLSGKEKKRIERGSGISSNLKHVQDEIIRVEPIGADEKSKKIQNRTNGESRISTRSGIVEHVEPVITVITPNSRYSSSNSSDPSVIVHSNKNEKIRLTQRKQKRRRGKATKSTFIGNAELRKGRSLVRASALVTKSACPQQQKRLQKFEPLREMVLDVHSNVGTSTETSFIHPNPFQKSDISNKKKCTTSGQLTLTQPDSEDASDTSTSYASLPITQHNLSYPNDVTSILQMLDSPVEEIGIVRTMSPVSTPDTPSSRIIRISSNKRNSDKVEKVLQFERVNKSQKNTNKQTYFPWESKISFDKESTSDNNDVDCHNKNPTCRGQGEYGPHSVRLPNRFPETSEKYDELQSICTERIASLTSLIHRIRDEQREFDSSFLTPSDDTTVMEMPSPRPARSDLYSVQKLVKSIEAIHSQLAETLSQSQQIIIGSIKPKHNDLDNNNDLSTLKMHGKSIKTSRIGTNIQQGGEKSKVKIIRNERVNIDLERFKHIRFMSKNAKLNNIPHNREKLVEELSREILEQSESSIMPVLVRPPKLMSCPRKKTEESKDQKTIDDGKVTDEELNLQVSRSRGPVSLYDEKEEAAKPPSNLTSNDGRSPSSSGNLNIHYTVNLEEPCYDLSTIVEFDTPKTEHRGEGTVQSQFEEIRRILSLGESKNRFSAFGRHRLNEVHVGEESLSSGENYKSFENRKSSLRNMQQFKLSQLEDDFRRSPESLLINHSTKKIGVNLEFDASSTKQGNGDNINEKITSSSVSSFSGLSGISRIVSSSISGETLWASSPPEEIEDRLKKLGIGWAITTLRKTREASALSSSSSSDLTTDLSQIFLSLMETLKGHEVSNKMNECMIPCTGLPDLSNVSSISIKAVSQSTGRAVLTKARTSTPNLQVPDCNSESSLTTSGSTS